jgi:hypothetical protein
MSDCVDGINNFLCMWHASHIGVLLGADYIDSPDIAGSGTDITLLCICKSLQ